MVQIRIYTTMMELRFLCIKSIRYDFLGALCFHHANHSSSQSLNVGKLCWLYVVLLSWVDAIRTQSHMYNLDVNLDRHILTRVPTFSE